MKRFIDLGNQTFNCDEGHKEFAFYCTVTDSFDCIGGSYTFETVGEFMDYAKNDDEFERYLGLIPESWEK